MNLEEIKEYIVQQRRNGTSWGDIYFELNKYILDCFYDIELCELVDDFYGIEQDELADDINSEVVDAGT